MNSKMHLSTRHPQVVMIFDEESEVSGASSIISEHIKEYRAIKFDRHTVTRLIAYKPAVILIALSKIDKSIEYYSSLIKANKLHSPHYAILLCKNKESAIAFRCCMKGLFNNYFVYQPLYEQFRLLMTIQSGFEQCQSSAIISQYNDDKFDQLDTELSELIDYSGQCKQELMTQIQQHRDSLELQKTESNKASALENSVEALRPSMTDAQLQPLLSLLENDIKSYFNNMIDGLANQKNTVNKAAKMQKKPPKPAPLIENYGIPYPEEPEPEVADEEGPEKILVVEDNAIYREMLTMVLTKEGFDVTAAEDGICALKAVKAQRFDLILMDLYMPKLDGVNTTKQIRKISGGVEIPIIALTGNKNKDNAKLWVNYGLKGYLIKPSTKDEILMAVRNGLLEDDELE